MSFGAEVRNSTLECVFVCVCVCSSTQIMCCAQTHAIHCSMCCLLTRVKASCPHIMAEHWDVTVQAESVVKDSWPVVCQHFKYE